MSGTREKFLLAEQAFNRKEYAETISYLNEVLQEEADHLSSYALRGNAKTKLKQDNEADKDFEKAISLATHELKNPDLPGEKSIELSNIALGAVGGKKDIAHRKEIEIMSSLFENSTQAEFKNDEELYKKLENLTAFFEFKKAMAHKQLGNQESASVCFKRFLERSKKRPGDDHREAYLFLAVYHKECYASFRKYKAAFLLLNNSQSTPELNLEISEGDLRFKKYMQGELQLTENICDPYFEAEKFASHPVELLLKLGCAKFLLSDHSDSYAKESINYLEKYVARKPDDAFCHYLLGVAQLRLLRLLSQESQYFGFKMASGNLRKLAKAIYHFQLAANAKLEISNIHRQSVDEIDAVITIIKQISDTISTEELNNIPEDTSDWQVGIKRLHNRILFLEKTATNCIKQFIHCIDSTSLQIVNTQIIALNLVNRLFMRLLEAINIEKTLVNAVGELTMEAQKIVLPLLKDNAKEAGDIFSDAINKLEAKLEGLQHAETRISSLTSTSSSSHFATRLRGVEARLRNLITKETSYEKEERKEQVLR